MNHSHQDQEKERRKSQKIRKKKETISEEEDSKEEDNSVIWEEIEEDLEWEVDSEETEDSEEEEMIWEKWEEEEIEDSMKERMKTTITMEMDYHQEMLIDQEEVKEVKDHIEEIKTPHWWEISSNSRNSEKKWIEAEDLEEEEVEELEVDLEIEEEEISSKFIKPSCNILTKRVLNKLNNKIWMKKQNWK